MNARLRLAVLPDFLEEGWPSMDLCAEMLPRYWPDSASWSVQSRSPNYWSAAGRMPVLKSMRQARNVDRLLNRWLNYPRFASRIRRDFDLFHVVDHSYSHLVHSLPADKTGVYCHDLDVFRSLTQPELEPRPRWYRWMASRILKGLQSAAVVFYSTKAVHADILRFKLLEPKKLVHAPYGVDDAFCVAADDSDGPTELDGLRGVPWILHVGSTIPRKRMDVLLQILAKARERIPDLKLCKLGTDWTQEQSEQIARDDLQRSIVHLGMVDKNLLIEAYRRAKAVVITSDAEGFGLPVIEAMACGATVIASDIPVLRESGGTGAVFAPVGDIDAWTHQIERVFAGDRDLPNLQARLAWAGRFRWSEHARIIAEAYEGLGG